MSDPGTAPQSSGRPPTPQAAPPFDPELAHVLAALDPGAREPVTPENLAARQQRDATSRPRPTA
ncbi:alpha/beta hydrolase, partial [Streptomyces sp. T-3]|nr:alpha/beta hydrolase [Streptomyces sp. T-3]